MLKKILNTFGTRLLSAILNLAIAVIVSRVLGPEGKGQQGIILATVAYVLVFANLFGGSAIIYLVPRFKLRLVMVPAYIWALLTSILLYFVLTIFSLAEEQFVIHIVILSALSAFTAINSSILIGKEKITKANAVALVQPMVITLGLYVLFSVAGLRSINAYIYAFYISVFLAFVVSLAYIWKYIRDPAKHSVRDYFQVAGQLFRYGILNQLSHIFQLLSFRMSYYWLEITHSSAEVGVYSNGTSLVESIWLISRSISLVQYARIANTDDQVYAQKLSLQLTFAGLVISILPLAVLSILPSSFFVFVFGEGFSDVGAVILSLAPGVLFFTVALILGHYFSGRGKYHINTISSFAGMLVAALFFSILIPKYGAIGAGWASSISYFVTSLMVIIFFIAEAKVSLGEALPKAAELRLVFKDLFRGKEDKTLR